MNKAHIITAKKRTQDIFTEDKTDFESLLLSPNVLIGLKKAGFYQPSPIQLQAIPLAKCGLDLICQAKSGTGKTCVFAVCALEAVNTKVPTLQVLVLAPTREIAHQIHSVVMTIGVKMASLKCCLLIGGIPVENDIVNITGCQIAVGTPGRVKHHIEQRNISTESIRLFVLDEADKLLEEGSFQKQINWIFSTLGQHKQMLALSATYPESLATFLTNYMTDPVHVRINPTDVTLKGISQFYASVMYHPLPHKAFLDKCSLLLDILKKIPFQQCMVFSNYQTRAEELSHKLNRQGWPCTFIAGSQQQSVRLHAMNQLKNYNCRVLITTDLTSRGIDCENVNLVINLDLPWDTETYLHRIGRAGRFGSYALAISIVTVGDELKTLFSISDEIKRKISPLPDNLERLPFLIDCEDNFLPQESVNYVLGGQSTIGKENGANSIVPCFIDPPGYHDMAVPKIVKSTSVNEKHCSLPFQERNKQYLKMQIPDTMENILSVDEYKTNESVKIGNDTASISSHSELDLETNTSLNGHTCVDTTTNHKTEITPSLPPLKSEKNVAKESLVKKKEPPKYLTLFAKRKEANMNNKKLRDTLKVAEEIVADAVEHGSELRNDEPVVNHHEPKSDFLLISLEDSFSENPNVKTASVNLSAEDSILSAVYVNKKHPDVEETPINSRCVADGTNECDVRLSATSLLQAGFPAVKKLELVPAVVKKNKSPRFDRMSVSFALQSLNINADKSKQNTEVCPNEVGRNNSNEYLELSGERSVIFQRKPEFDAALYDSDTVDIRFTARSSESSDCHFDGNYLSDDGESCSSCKSSESGDEAEFSSDSYNRFYSGKTEVNIGNYLSNLSESNYESASEAENCADSNETSEEETVSSSHWNQNYFKDCYQRAYLNHVRLMRARNAYYNMFFF